MVFFIFLFGFIFIYIRFNKSYCIMPHASLPHVEQLQQSNWLCVKRYGRIIAEPRETKRVCPNDNGSIANFIANFIATSPMVYLQIV
ncbi:hypothetical protein HYPBUDRAFT_220279 [Hyphopichia burtonii NRRL Y-1933]|uniref:Uncharacterized protein n=1 Tax=Hyphopichia burtonii NRRL Y-1933 TaxID=984485 RepID=A0A1E4RFD8_9ASCO|nr:hypothetical protein HYPBUDRAFT_220279 [Hyphopichia burtonii NRRL Y-1933]ODV65982.1 hypothetical protein HYPBUDRAFT_220279 [Hyphopichia burtonii NRRL Y-1933]